MSRMKDAAETTVEMIESMELEGLAALPWASESVRYAARCARRGYLGGAVTGLVRDAMLTDRIMLEMEGRIGRLERLVGAADGRTVYPGAPPVAIFVSEGSERRMWKEPPYWTPLAGVGEPTEAGVTDGGEGGGAGADPEDCEVG